MEIKNTSTILPKKVDILGVQMTPVEFDNLSAYIDETIATRQKTRLFHVNAHMLNMSWSNAPVREIMNKAEVVYCDGFGVKLAAQILGKNLPERYTPPDWFRRIGPNWARHQYSIFWVGAEPGIAERAAAQYQSEFPDVRIAGTYHGYFQKQGVESQAVIEKINAVRPDILVVGFGMPAQEHWIMENFEQIDAAIFIPVGAAIDYIAGNVPRGPNWMTDRGLEWFSRLVVEPRRLWRRYIIGLPQLFARVLAYRFLGLKPRIME